MKSIMPFRLAGPIWLALLWLGLARLRDPENPYDGGARGTNLGRSWELGNQHRQEPYRQAVWVMNLGRITHLSPDQWEGQPLTKNIRETHANLAKPLGNSSHVAKKYSSFQTSQFGTSFLGCLLVLQHHNPGGQP